jgi:hypothetical protein
MTYRVSVLYWKRSHDGDDWVDSEDLHYFNALEEAQTYAKNVLLEKTRLIEVRVFDSDKLIATYDIQIPDVDYHLREF